MDNKPTKRERKDDAKKRRLEEMRRRQRRARRRKMVTFGILAAIVLAIGGTAAASRGRTVGARNKAAKLAAAANCGAPKGWPIEGAQHTAAPAKSAYKTDPPTSGAHWASQQPPAPGPTGALTSVLQDEQVVHNLEHGHVAIQYKIGSIPDSLVKKLTEVVRSDPTRIQLSPRAHRNADLAFSAWGVSQKCVAPNDKVIAVAKEFVKRFKNQGPEAAPGQPVFQGEPPPDPSGQPSDAPEAPSSPPPPSAPPAS